jgi:serine/threonine-protein kinase
MSESLPVVLFVDDEERILRSLSLLFRRRARVLTAGSGAEALRLVGERTVHVVVSDQRMPGMTGVEVLRGVRERSPQTMRVLLTGYADLSAIVSSVNDGEIFRFVEKPWAPQQLIEVVEQAAAVAMAQVASPVPGAAAGEGLRVLVLDEGREVLDLVREALPPGAAMLHAATLEAALARLAEEDVAVLVVDLPSGGDMAEALKTLKRYSPQTLSIVATRFADVRLLIGLINQGQVFRFLPKPLGRELLRRSLQSALERHRQFQAEPTLLRRHAVEAAPGGEAPAEAGLPGRLLGYWRRIRERAAARARA